MNMAENVYKESTDSGSGEDEHIITPYRFEPSTSSTETSDDENSDDH